MVPWKDGRGKSGFLEVIALVFGFSPISSALLQYVHGNFTPSRYSSLSLSNPSDVEIGVLAGELVPVLLTNHTGHTRVYQWSATKNSALISQGEKTLDNGRTTTILISSHGANAGRLRRALNGTEIFVTVPILNSGL